MASVEAPPSGNSQGPFLDSFMPLKGTYISRTVATDPIHDNDQGTLSVLAALEQKRQQLEQQIADFVQQKQEEYRAFEKDILKGSHLDDLASKPPQSPESDKSSTAHDQPEQAKEIPSKHDSGVDFDQPTEKDAIESGSVTPVRDRDFDLAGLLLPSFLPLLDSTPIERPSSSMSVPAAIESPRQTPPATSGKGARQQSAPPALSTLRTPPASKPARRKSSMRSSMDGTTARPSRKSVSLLVDDCVVRPADISGDTTEDALAVDSPPSALESLSPKPIQTNIKPTKPRDPSKLSKKLRSPPPSSPPQSPFGFFSPPRIQPKFKASSPPTPTALQSPVEDQKPPKDADPEEGELLRPLSPIDTPSPTATSTAIDFSHRRNGTSPHSGTPTPISNDSESASPRTPTSRILSNSYHRPDLTPEAMAIAAAPELPASSYVGSLEGEARGASWMEANAMALAAVREGEKRERDGRRERLERFEREAEVERKQGPPSVIWGGRSRGLRRRESEEDILGRMEGV